MSERPLRSIGSKLNRLVCLSVGAALVVAGLLSVWHEADRYLTWKTQTLLATAKAFGAASSKAVASGDHTAVIQGIRSIGLMSGLLYAAVYDSNGELLAEIGEALRLDRDTSLGDAEQGSPVDLLTSRTVRVTASIQNAGATVGRIVLVSDTADLAGGFASALAVGAAGSAVALVIGLLLSSRLQRSITRPLEALAIAMSDVERTGGYEPVRGIATNDETGVLASRFNSMIEEIGRATSEILAREDEIIGRLSRAAEQRDDQTGQHVVRVAKVGRIIAQQLGLDPSWIENFSRASPMHDVGKISIPDSILFKPGRLDPEERSQMERHAEAGHRVLAGSNSTLVQLAAEIAISHHERWDGKGYPHGLSGTDIPLSGRITAVGDVCDALLSARPYKQPWTLEAVKAHLVENAGLHFDPTCVAALITRWPDLERIYAAPEPIAEPELQSQAAA